jgi:hypothetical protein
VRIDVPIFGWASYLVETAEATSPFPASSRGYDPSTWRQVKLVSQVAPEFPADYGVSLKVLRAGSCPNASRVFFTLTHDGPDDPSAHLAVGTYLGTPARVSRIRAGQRWDSSIAGANRRVNSLIREGRRRLTKHAVPSPIIREHYNGRISELRSLRRRRRIPNDSLIMKLKPSLDRIAAIGIQGGEPDGLWLASTRNRTIGGIFECKLTGPKESKIRPILSSYALMAEHEYEEDFDVGFLLRWDPTIGKPVLDRFDLGEADRQICIQNLEKFIQLLAIRTIGKQQRTRRPPTLKRILARPPTPPLSVDCAACDFREGCRTENLARA